MKVCILLLVSCVLLGESLSQSENLDRRWNEFKQRYHKTYSNVADELGRKKTWLENLKFNDEHNRLYELGLKSFQVGENKFSDLVIVFFSFPFFSLL